MSTHNVCFCGEIRKIFTWYPVSSRVMYSVSRQQMQSDQGHCCPHIHTLIGSFYHQWWDGILHLSTLLNTFWDNEGVIMKGSVKWSTVQSWAEFCLKQDSSEVRRPATSPSECFPFLWNWTLPITGHWRFITNPKSTPQNPVYYNKQAKLMILKVD